MKPRKYEVRVNAEITFDFDILAYCEGEARLRVENYLRYVEGGKLSYTDRGRPFTQAISVRCKDGDKLTNCFVMSKEIEDVNEGDE